MEEVIHYLELKNQYYEKFYSITAKFLKQIEQDRWDGMDLLVDNRERILNILRAFDVKIAALFEKLNLPPGSIKEYRPEIKRLLDERSAMVNRIVALDLELIGRIEDVKTETIRELKKTLEQGQQLGSFEENTPPAPRDRRLKEV